MKLNMDSITYDNGNGGIEFLEKWSTASDMGTWLTKENLYMSKCDYPAVWIFPQHTSNQLYFQIVLSLILAMGILKLCKNY